MKYFVIVCSYFLLTTGAWAIGKENDASPQGPVADEEYIFDPQLFRGGRFNQTSLARLTRPNAIAPGRYQLDIYTNGKFTGNYDVLFAEQADGTVQPCLHSAIFKEAGLRMEPELIAQLKESSACLLISQAAQGASSYADIAQLRLNLTIPQKLLNVLPYGYVNPEDLDSGHSLGFINYITNFYHVSYSGKGSRNLDSAWVSLSGGINLGSWQYRQLSNLNWNRYNGNKWNDIRRYFQRPLPGMKSQLAAGELMSNGRFFSGLSYNGIRLATDERMLPDSMRGYAPLIRGVANTQAKVSVRQNGAEIYQTTVPPGAFEINDLYPTSYSGDLKVTVTEADGAVSTFTVPFSAVPESMRPGLSRYSVEVGKVNNSKNKDFFADLIWQRGISNSVTTNSGLRMANNYHAVVLGGVYGSTLGAMGMDMTYSHAKFRNQSTANGWMAHLSWSKTFQSTDTTVSLAGYRYSSSGYRDFNELTEEWGVGQTKGEAASFVYRQRSRFDLSLSQSLSHYGNFFISGAIANYRQGGSRTTQLQAGYSNSFRNGVSINLSVSRQYSGNHNDYGRMETMTSLSFLFPLGGNGPRSTSVNTSWTHSSQGGSQYQSAFSGMLDTEQTTNYSVNVMRDQKYRQTTVGGNLQTRLPAATLGLNGSQGKGYWQTSGSVQGALAAHAGGVTFGPYLGETFALVEAKGASGARIFNSPQIAINDSGYALLPSITPYHYNRITLDPEGMDGEAELIDSEKKIAPVAGAGVKIVFRTRTGNALLIKTRLADGTLIPPGAEVLNENGSVVGMAGQGGQIYTRTEKQKGVLTVRWGEEAAEQCRLPYAVSEEKKRQALISLTAVCTR
ncbi:fimbria/pilus outer membrane usher protein [Pantoea sp.]|uniref:fimbria/pilus outer membrane usher protein n=1 Tax=Pantoea sp. TaxID=69393 RepID=UPI00289B6702|nr:fimbria/pilus outer membrane usher protein [Pantoea sp.]